MKSISLAVDEHYFNLLWRSIVARENELLAKISDEPDDSDEAALFGNDLIYLRLCKKDLEEKAKAAKFADSVFLLEDKFIDLLDMT